MATQAQNTPASVTAEALTFPVDYNDVTAIDPPSWAKFTTQAQITQFLVAHGTSNFKHLMACWDACPDILAHDVTFTLAAGVHRPRVGGESFLGTNGWLFDNKTIQAGNVNINGVLPSSFDEIIASATITAIGGGSDPYVDFAGTPFSGLELRGYFLVTDVGQLTVINRHTNSRLYVNSLLSPTPSAGMVAKPATILRNSLDDVNPVGTSAGIVVNKLYMSYAIGVPGINFSNLKLETWGSGYPWGLYINDTQTVYVTNTLFDLADDYDTYGSVPYRAIQLNGTPCSIGFVSSSIRGPYLLSPPVSAGSGGVDLYMGAFFYGFASYIGGLNSYNFSCWYYSCEIWVTNCVFDLTAAGLGAFVYGGVLFAREYGGLGILTTFRNNSVGLRMGSGATLTGCDYLAISFDHITTACIQFENEATYTTDGSAGFLDGGNNTGIGINIIGPSAILNLSADTSVTGTLGDVRMSDGEILDYATISLQGPFTDVNGNFVKKASA